MKFKSIYKRQLRFVGSKDAFTFTLYHYNGNGAKIISHLISAHANISPCTLELASE